MPEYIIKNDRDRNLVIEADKYVYLRDENAYEFVKDGTRVATVPALVFSAIVEKNAEKADFYDHYDVNEDEDESDDVCLGCRFQEFLDSDEFRDAVFELVDFYHNQDEGDDPPAESEKEEFPIEKWQTKDGKIQYGFHTPKGFVNTWDDLEFAKQCREIHKSDPNTYWSYWDLTGATKLEDNL